MNGKVDVNRLMNMKNVVIKLWTVLWIGNKFNSSGKHNLDYRQIYIVCLISDFSGVPAGWSKSGYGLNS